MKNVNSPSIPRWNVQLTRYLKVLTLSLTMLFLMIPENVVQACMGTPVPPCGRSIFLGKFTPGVVVFPAGGGPINVPIGVLPFAWWNPTGLPNAPICPQPNAATLTLTLTCLPSGAVIGPLAFPVAIPAFPGAQPLGAPVNFVIPAGTFAPGAPPQFCLVVGTYTVTFTDGVTLVFNGDTEVCIVPPSPLDETAPQLDMQYIPIDGEDYQTCRRGDQANFYFLIANNDPTQSVDLDLVSNGRQISQLPVGYTADDAYDGDVYSISLPEEGTDAFAAAFADELIPGELLEEPDPSVPDDQMLSRSFTLQPCEAIIICIAMRSYGMCANGSCNERLVKVAGTWANGDPALGCASTLYVVDDAPAKTVLCEVFDSLKVGPGGEAIWRPGNFGDLNGPFPHASTFAVGNLPSGPTGGGFRTSGDLNPDLFPSASSDYTRINAVPMVMEYTVNYNSPQCNNGVNQVLIQGIDNPGLDFISVPVINFQFSPDPLLIILDLFSNQIVISVNGEILFEGPIDIFFVDPPPEFCIDPEICRIIKKQSDFSEKTIFAEPRAGSRLFAIPNDDPGCDTLEVYDNNTELVEWEATISGDGLSLPSASGMGLLGFCYDDVASLPVVPATTISFIDITCPDALNNVYKVPVAIRVKDTTTISVKDLIANDQRFVLHPSMPNPFNDVTNIKVSLSESSPLSLKIYNCFGQEVRTLLTQQGVGTGDFHMEWDGRDNAGNLLANGIYICQMKAGAVMRASNMVLVK